MSPNQIKSKFRLAGEVFKHWSRDALRETGRVVDRGDGFLELERTPEENDAVDAAILAEFNGRNHLELARHYRVSFQRVYSLVSEAQREAAAEERRPTPQDRVANPLPVAP